MNSCKPTLEELKAMVDSLSAQFAEKMRDAGRPQASVTRTRTAPTRRTVFLEGEVLIFGGVPVSEVTSTLFTMGLMPDSYTLTTEGGPLYFIDRTGGPDTAAAPLYYLTHADLPYGFNSPDGYFQYSSPEIAALRPAAAPQMVDDAYIVYGNKGPLPSNLTYDKFKALYDSGDLRYRPKMMGMGWTPSTNPQDALNDVAQEKYAGVNFITGETVDRRHYVQKADFVQAIKELGNPQLTQITSYMLNGLSTSSYTGEPYAGWRWRPKTTPLPNISLRAPLLVEPRNQLEYLDVNPAPQEPYRGGEGVYPVVLVEMLRDVNLVF